MKSALLTAAVLTLAATASAQSVGKFVSKVELDDFQQTKARSFDDHVGRAVLVEFFAYW